MNPIKRFIFNYLIPFAGKINVGRNHYVNVIYYHDIVKGDGRSFMQMNIEVFRKQMKYIASQGYESLSFDELKDPNKLLYDGKRIVIAFDDGWLSNYTEIFDFMKSLGVKYNIYLVVGEIGNNPEYLTWDMVREMHKSGIVGFGVHTYTHQPVANLTEIDPGMEFMHANDIFKKELGFDPEDFCYPYGNCSEESNEYLSTQTNYKRIYTSSMMYSYQLNDRIIFGRNGISNDEPFRVFKAKLKGYFNVWRSLIQLL